MKKQFPWQHLLPRNAKIKEGWGFSLIDLIITSGLLLIVMVILYEIMFYSVELWHRGDALADAGDDTAIAISRLTAELRETSVVLVQNRTSTLQAISFLSARSPDGFQTTIGEDIVDPISGATINPAYPDWRFTVTYYLQNGQLRRLVTGPSGTTLTNRPAAPCTGGCSGGDLVAIGITEFTVNPVLDQVPLGGSAQEPVRGGLEVRLGVGRQYKGRDNSVALNTIVNPMQPRGEF